MRASFTSVLPLMATVLLAGCQQSDHKHDRIELTLWKNQAGLEEEAASKSAIERFNVSQAKWHVTAQSMPQGGYSQSIVAASLARRMPCILAVDHPQLARFVWAGHLQPLEDHVPESLLTQVIPSALGRYRGTIYSVGQFDAALALFARRSVLVRVGARIPTLDKPWSGAEFQSILERLKSSGAFRYPFDLSTRDSKADWWTYGFSPLLQSFGGDLVNRKSRRSAEGVLNGADGLRFGAWFQTLFTKGLVNRAEPDENGFVSGRTAIAYTGNWWTPAYRAAAGDDLLILPPPDFGHGVVIGGGSWQWGISKTCPYPDGAGAFINFLMQPREIAAISDAIGLIPVTAAAAEQSRDYRPGGSNRIFYDLSRRFARQRPETPSFTEISNGFYKATRDIMDGKDVHDAFDDAVDEIDDAIEATGAVR